VDAPACGVRVLLQHRFSLDPDAGEGDQSKAGAQKKRRSNRTHSTRWRDIQGSVMGFGVLRGCLGS